MIYSRLEPLPVELEREAEQLSNEYLSHFGDDDEIPDHGLEDYVYQHASKELYKALHERDEIVEEARKRGVYAG